jgi:hypothetical protein
MFGSADLKPKRSPLLFPQSSQCSCVYVRDDYSGNAVSIATNTYAVISGSE